MNKKLPWPFWLLIGTAVVLLAVLLLSFIDDKKPPADTASEPKKETPAKAKVPGVCHVSASGSVPLPSTGKWALLNWLEVESGEFHILAGEMNKGSLVELKISTDEPPAHLIKLNQWSNPSGEAKKMVFADGVGAIQSANHKTFAFQLARNLNMQFRSLMGWCGKPLPDEAQLQAAGNRLDPEIVAFAPALGVYGIYHVAQLGAYQPMEVPHPPKEFYQFSGAYIIRPTCPKISADDKTLQIQEWNGNLITLARGGFMSNEVRSYGPLVLPNPTPLKIFNNEQFKASPAKIGTLPAQAWVETGSKTSSQGQVYVSTDAKSWTPMPNLSVDLVPGQFAKAPRREGPAERMQSLRWHQGGLWQTQISTQIFWKDHASPPLVLPQSEGSAEDSAVLWEELKPRQAVVYWTATDSAKVNFAAIDCRE